MKLDMQKKSILKILGENDKNIKLRKIWGVVLVYNQRLKNVPKTLPSVFRALDEVDVCLRMCMCIGVCMC